MILEYLQTTKINKKHENIICNSVYYNVHNTNHIPYVDVGGLSTDTINVRAGIWPKFYFK